MNRPKAFAIPLILAGVFAAPAAAAEQRPVTGQFTARAGAAAPRCGDHPTLGFEIRGTAAHLGALTAIGSNCTESTFSTSAVAIWDGVATFVAADGSTINTVSEGGQAAPVGGLAAFEVTHTIIGGTRRFANAAGVWTVSGVINFATGRVAGQVSGWLSY